ncbi:MAG: GNAT family N-acetyltransferase [Thermoleophilia bacterium]|jgi:hypothetical protein|nr:GNAT family N-acetyltransferase [Thermoleophilia bacterium]
MSAFLPHDHPVPPGISAERFTLRPITVHDVVRDYDAVMGSQAHLWARFGAAWGWPPADLTLEQDLIDLAWHQKEADLRRSFNYAVVSPDGARLLGCVYLDPPTRAGWDAEAYAWTRADALDLEDEVVDRARAWIAAEWPFPRVAWPGRDIPWAEWDALPPRDR